MTHLLETSGERLAEVASLQVDDAGVSQFAALAKELQIWLSAFADGELPAPQADLLMAALEEDPALLAQLELIAATSSVALSATESASLTDGILAAVAPTELDAEAASGLFQARQQMYEVRNKALEGMIMDRLVEAEAKAKGLTSEAYLQAEVEDKIQARYAKARAASELTEASVQSRVLEVEQATANVEAQSRLSELRAELGLGSGTEASEVDGGTTG